MREVVAGVGEGSDSSRPGFCFGGEPGITKGKVADEATQVAMASVNWEAGIAALIDDGGGARNLGGRDY